MSTPAMLKGAFAHEWEAADVGAGNESFCKWGFVAFLLANAALFIRPSDFVSGLENFPLYGGLLFLSICLSGPAIYELIRRPPLARSPISVCVIGLLFAAVFSHLVRLRQWEARDALKVFGGVVVYYFLIIALITNSHRLERFLTCVGIYTIAAAILAVLAYHGWVLSPALQPLVQDPASGSDQPILRLRSAGIFNDPNDFCLALVSAIFICIWRIRGMGRSVIRTLWIGSVLLFLYAVALTGSRGGLIALGAGIATLLVKGRRRRLSLPLIAVAALALLPLLPSRQTDITIDGDTSLSRIKIWSDGLQLIRESPVLGVGFGRFSDEVGMVAHNSFLHCFAELGIFGGMMFLGAFVQAIWGLSRLRDSGKDGDAVWRGMGPYLMAMTVAAAVGMLSLSRSYIVTTYTLLGCVAAFQLMAPAVAKAELRLNVGFIHRSILASIGFILCVWLLVRVTVHWR